MSNLNYIIMRNLKLFFAASILFFAIQVSAANGAPLKPDAQLRAQLVELIGTEYPAELNAATVTAEVIFTVNSQGEVIILSIHSSNPLADNFIKRKINYKKIDYREKKVGDIYLLPVKMVNPDY